MTLSHSPARPKRHPLMIVLLCILGLLAVVVALAVAGALIGDDSSEGSAEVPAYRVVDQSGTTIVVEVDATPPGDGLRQIFDDIRQQATEDSGPFVSINCSFGGTEFVDNRLANGKFAVGALGRARTGLGEGEFEFEVLEGRSCP